jgi:hypothetical protein
MYINCSYPNSPLGKVGPLHPHQGAQLHRVPAQASQGCCAKICAEQGELEPRKEQATQCRLFSLIFVYPTLFTARFG